MSNFIRRDCTITVKDNISVLDNNIYLFQNDRNIDIYFTIVNFKFDFFTSTQTSEDIVEKSNASYATIRVLKPNGEKFVSDAKIPITSDKKVLFTITEDFIDEVYEVGKYKLQISLYDDQYGKITIPYIEFEVLAPIFEDDFVENIVLGQIDITKIGMSRIAYENEETAQASLMEVQKRVASTLGISDGNEIALKDWRWGEIISAERMNAINNNIRALWDALDSLETSLDLQSQNVTYTNDGYTGITNVKEALDYLLYTPLSIKSFNISIDRVLEKGRNVNGCVLNWSYNKTIQEQTLTIGSSVIPLSINNSTYSYSNVISNNISFTLKAKDERNKIVNSTINIVYCNKIYWGASSSTTYNNSFLLNELNNSTISDNRNRTIRVNATSNQYIYYVIPSRLGTPIFKVGGFEGGFSKVSTISFTNIYNFTENYDIYRSDNVNLGDTTIVIS